MADQTRHLDELRIPIKMTLPWLGKLTREGKPWPRDRLGRDWPSHCGRPVFPIDLLPVGFAPGTDEIYRKIAEKQNADVADANIAALPNTAQAQQKLRAAGIERPLDDSGYPQWNERLERALEDIVEKLDTDFGVGSSPEKDQAARIAVERLLRDLRQQLLHLQRVSANGGIEGATSV